MVVAKNKIDGNKKYTSNAGNFDGHADTAYSGAMQGASPNGAHSWLHAKPLDAAIGQVPAPYRPGGHHGR
jgi:hypothetical protein